MTVSVREALRAALGKTLGYKPSEFAPCDLEKFEAALEARGFAVVPLKATLEMHNAASFSDGQAKHPVISIGDGGLLFLDWRGADFTRMYAAAIAARPRVGKEG